jgi:hypothetical protein
MAKTIADLTDLSYDDNAVVDGTISGASFWNADVLNDIKDQVNNTNEVIADEIGTDTTTGLRRRVTDNETDVATLQAYVDQDVSVDAGPSFTRVILGGGTQTNNSAAASQAFVNSALQSNIYSASENSIIQHSQDITEDATVYAGFNAFSIGPVNINAGATVTVESTWLILPIEVGPNFESTTITAKTATGLTLQDDNGNLGVKILDGGDVGIKNATPTEALDVTGNALISGAATSATVNAGVINLTAGSTSWASNAEAIAGTESEKFMAPSTVKAVLDANSDHNQLTGKQGGTTDEFYHLTNSEYTGINTGSLVADTISEKTTDNGVAVDGVVLKDTTIFLGDPDTDGTWKVTLSGGDLVFSKRETGSYSDKATIAA